MFNGGYREGSNIYLQVDVFSLPATNNTFNISRVYIPHGGRISEAHDGQDYKATFERGDKYYISVQRLSREGCRC